MSFAFLHFCSCCLFEGSLGLVLLGLYGGVRVCMWQNKHAGGFYIGCVSFCIIALGGGLVVAVLVGPAFHFAVFVCVFFGNDVKRVSFSVSIKKDWG